MEKFGVTICVPMDFADDDALYVLDKVFHRLKNGSFVASNATIRPVGLERSFDVNFEAFSRYRRFRMEGTIKFVNIENCHYYGDVVNKISEELYCRLRDYIKMRQDLLTRTMNSVYGLSPREREYYQRDVVAAEQVFYSRFRVPVTPKKVIFNNPATIVLWSDGTKTVVKRQRGDRYNKETGLAMCYVKKFCGDNTSRGLNDILKLANEKEEK